MKKETIFRYEINESMAASAAMSCLKNRNNHKQLNETSEFDARFEFRKDLRELASPIAKKAYMIIRKQYGDSMWRRLYMDDCDERGLIDMLNMYAERGLEPQQIVNKMLGVREDEETVDYAQLADDVCASYRGPLSKLDLKDSINYIIKMVAKKIGKTVDALTPEELTAIQKAAKHSVWYVSEQEEFDIEASRKAYYSQDEPDYDDDSHGIRLILNMLMKRGDITKNDIPNVQEQIKSMLDAEGMWIGDDESEAQRFIEMYWDNQEQEESTDDKYAIAKQVMANYNPDMDEYEDPSVWLLYAIQEQIGKQFLYLPKKEVKLWKKAIDATLHEYELQKEQEDGINQGGMHNSVQVGHIMNTPSMNDGLDTEYFSDLEEQEAYYENFRAIAELVADQIDRENGKDIANNMDTLFTIVREVWNNNPDDLYIWDFDDVQEDDCYKFFDKYYETIKDEYLKREHNNIMAATHDDLFAS